MLEILQHMYILYYIFPASSSCKREGKSHPMAIPDEVVQKVKGIIREAEEGERFVKSVHAALKELEASGHLYKLVIHNRHVGCHPLSRDGSGINGVDVHQLLDDIVTCERHRRGSSGQLRVGV